MVSAACEVCVLRNFNYLSPDNQKLVSALRVSEGKLVAGGLLTEAGHAANHLYTLLDGWAGVFSHLPGEPLHLVDIRLPGDLVGMWGCLTGKYVHSVQALTPLRYCVLDGATLRRQAEQHGKFAFALMRQLCEDFSRQEMLTARLNEGAAVRRLAYLFLEVTGRLKLVGHSDELMCLFPLNRSHLAMLAGISEMHVSRTLAELRRDGLIQLANNILFVPDKNRLAEAAEVTLPLPLKERMIL